MRRISLCVFMLVLVAALPAAAQGVRPEVSLGYQWQHVSSPVEDSDETVSTNFPLGFNVDVAVPVSGPLSAVGQFDWSHSSPDEIEGQSLSGTGVEASLSTVAYAVGIRWNGKSSPSVTPYVQMLVGGARSSASVTVNGTAAEDIPTENSFMLQAGFGAALALSQKTDVIGQLDYRRLFASGGSNVIRFVGGVRVKL
jgi:opacity protein-like surface antigen